MTEEQQQDDNNNITAATAAAFPSSLPTGRVKRIIKLDKEISKINGEALFVIARSTELFLQSLAEKSSHVAIEKKRKSIKLDHIRIAVKRHQPTADFLLDSLPMLSQPSDPPERSNSRSRTDDKPVPAGTCRIDSFFHKGP